MNKALKIIGFFLVSILFLSIQIKEKPIFGHIYQLISPATRATQKATEDLISFSVDKTQYYSKKLFVNSVPSQRDTIKSKMSATKKTIEKAHEEVSSTEQEELNEIIKNHKK